MVSFVRAAWLSTIVCLVLYFYTMARVGSLKKIVPLIHRSIAVAIVLVILMSILMPSFALNIVDRFASIATPNEESGSEYRNRELAVMYKATVLGDRSCDNIVTFLFGHGDLSWSHWAPKLLKGNYDRNIVEQIQKGGGVLTHPGFNMTLAALFDNGLIGLLFYSLFWVAFIVGYFVSLRHCNDSFYRTILMATFLPVACVLICFQFSYDPISPFLWALIGVHLAARWHCRQLVAIDSQNNQPIERTV